MCQTRHVRNVGLANDDPSGVPDSLDKTRLSGDFLRVIFCSDGTVYGNAQAGVFGSRLALEPTGRKQVLDAADEMRKGAEVRKSF